MSLIDWRYLNLGNILILTNFHRRSVHKTTKIIFSSKVFILFPIKVIASVVIYRRIKFIYTYIFGVIKVLIGGLCRSANKKNVFGTNKRIIVWHEKKQEEIKSLNPIFTIACLPRFSKVSKALATGKLC